MKTSSALLCAFLYAASAAAAVLARVGPREELVDSVDEDALKYFHEPKIDDPSLVDIQRHYDIRYYRGVLDYEKKRDVQVHMVRAYLETFKELGLETWLAHGTLLGWWWNSNVRPLPVVNRHLY